MFGLKNRSKYVNAEFWLYDDHFQYPEQNLESLKNKKNFGVAFSGGGTRSASATLGQLRGLKDIGLMDNIKYISAVSGGSWAATPFVFLPPQISEDEFLGIVVPPEDIDYYQLKNVPKKSLPYIISDTVITDDFLREAARFGGDETYSRAIGNLFLEPFDLDDNHKFFTWDHHTLQQILKRNAKEKDENYYLCKEDFYLVREGRPFLVVGAVILDKKEPKKIPVEYTPYYTGVREYFDLEDPVGGGFLETFAYDSKSPAKKRNKSVTVKLGRKLHRFTLSDMIGSSGAAPEEFLYNYHINFIGFPEFRHWAFKPDHSFTEEEERAHGDGGLLENLGIMPLLARKVENIIVFINGKTQFKYPEKADPNNIDIASIEMSSSIKNLFFENEEDKFSKNIVLEGGKEKFKEIVSSFIRADKNGKTLLHYDKYKVLDNHHHGIHSYNTKICWVYNQRVSTWEEKLNYRLKKLIGYQDEKSEFTGELKRFPHYKTFFENLPKIIDLTKIQVGLLAHLSCWNITANKERLVSFFGWN